MNLINGLIDWCIHYYCLINNSVIGKFEPRLIDRQVDTSNISLINLLLLQQHLLLLFLGFTFFPRQFFIWILNNSWFCFFSRSILESGLILILKRFLLFFLYFGNEIRVRKLGGIQKLRETINWGPSASSTASCS